jgi:hypothetical protein
MRDPMLWMLWALTGCIGILTVALSYAIVLKVLT